jgi:hypothetical protein
MLTVMLLINFIQFEFVLMLACHSWFEAVLTIAFTCDRDYQCVDKGQRPMPGRGKERPRLWLERRR